MHSMDRYAEIRKQTARVRERPLLAAPKIPNELELQARWFAGEFGRKFQTLVGELVEIVQFGFWNREAGPDFQDAAIRLRRRIEVHGRDEALFQAIAEALGYKQNRLPFTLLAQRLPLAFLRKLREDAEALLFGVAGFLDTPDLDRQRKSTRSYLRSL